MPAVLALGVVNLAAIPLGVDISDGVPFLGRISGCRAVLAFDEVSAAATDFALVISRLTRKAIRP